VVAEDQRPAEHGQKDTCEDRSFWQNIGRTGVKKSDFAFFA
jgi:hypothetical protein